MDMPTGTLIRVLPKMMEGGGNENGFTCGVGFAAQSTSILGGRHQSSEIVSNASEAAMPTAVMVNTGTNEVINTGHGADQRTNQRSRKRHHRHTLQQIQEMESFFRVCPHPDEQQRKELGCALGLEPVQIKFWFQNKRTQMKAQHERQDNSLLRLENQKLRIENFRYKKALANACCSRCGGPSTNAQLLFEGLQLKLENAQLKEEIDRISSIAAKHLRMPLSVHKLSAPPPPPPAEVDFEVPSFEGSMNLYDKAGSTANIHGNNGELIRTLKGPTEAEKPFVTELALAAMDELLQMAQLKEPLWVSSMDLDTVQLDKQVYVKFFSRGITAANLEGFKTEASRESAIVKINHIQLVEAFMNVGHWAAMFSNIVSRAVTVDVLSIGVEGNYDGALQVTYAEFQAPAPQVASRSYYFVRYCKKNVDGTWAVVDVSLDRYLCMNRVGRSLRRPSGCIIEEVPNGYTKVTWVEHIEVDDDGNEAVSIYKPLLDSCIAFGAKRWIATLDRQCERIACSMSINIPPSTIDSLVIITPEGKKCILKLAERMVISFISGASCSTTPQWKVLSGTGAGAGDLRIMLRKTINEPGIPAGIILCAATSFWLPLEPKRVFDFLHDERTRTQWDILSSPGPVIGVTRIAYGREISNGVSLLRGANSSQSKMMILQESSSDPTGSFVIYAPVEMAAMNLVCRGGDPKYISLLPSGFAILPDGPPGTCPGGGSLLTIAFQILVDSVPTAKLSIESVTTINKLITGTVERINACLFDNGTYDPEDRVA